MAQTQRKRVCATLRSPRPALGSCVQLLWHRQNGHTTFFRTLLFPLCYWQLNASPDGSTGKLQVDRVLENGSRLGRSGWTLGSRTGPRKVRCPCVSLLDAILLLLTLPFHPGQDDDFFFFLETDTILQHFRREGSILSVLLLPISRTQSPLWQPVSFSHAPGYQEAQKDPGAPPREQACRNSMSPSVPRP